MVNELVSFVLILGVFDVSFKSYIILILFVFMQCEERQYIEQMEEINVHRLV
jgi:hypothetical protein